MIEFPKKRLFGLIGAPRAGKSQVAQYLKESRGFETFAFADQIKTEFGVSIEDFEAAKITGKIEEIRQQLWEFSAGKKATDPLYFIKKVMDNATNTDKSAVITDIRTEDEVRAFFEYSPDHFIKRIYWVKRNGEDIDDNLLKGSKLNYDVIFTLTGTNRARIISNNGNGLFEFLNYLENFFFTEDIMDLPTVAGDKFDNSTWRSVVSNYLSRFEVRRAT